MKYTPHTPADIEAALKVIGQPTVDDLFNDIPQGLRDPNLDLPGGLDETQLLAHMKALAARNSVDYPSFLGGGSRRHYVPSAVNALTFQSAFVTAYTPYQPEVSQGLLQGMFEYQSMMAELTGLDVSNSSLYDGATAVAEAALLAMRATGRERLIVSRGVHPDSRGTLHTFLKALGAPIDTLALHDGRTAAGNVPADTAAVVVQNPNHLGFLEDMRAAAEAAHAVGALLIAVVDPFTLALLATPGEYGADIAVGDGQPLGNDQAFGGPTFGFMVVREALLRQIPGRLVGQTVDAQGRRGFVLTLQAREQHIRRAKAKSNICSNHALMALQGAIHLAALGPSGLREAATVAVSRAHEMAGVLAEAGLQPVAKGRFFNELTVRLPIPAVELRARLAAHGIHGCVPIGSEYALGPAGLFAATELTAPADLSALQGALREVLA